MPIQDTSLNTISPAATSFMGYRAGAAAAFPHDIYSYLIKSIRDCDRSVGDQLLKRFLDGPQEMFEDMYAKRQGLIDLFDPASAPESALEYAKWIVGLGGSLDPVTSDLPGDDLRRLIAIAARMWKFKGSEFGLEETFEAITTRLARILNYFFFRLLSGEWELGREELGFDPWLLDLPGLEPRTAPTAVSVVSGRLRFDLTSLFPEYEDEGHEVRVKCLPTNETTSAWSAVEAGVNVVYTSFLGQTSPSTNVGDYLVGVDPDEYVSDVRIVDDGSLNRTMLESVLGVLRSAGERYYVRYLDFQDTFRESLLWDVVSGTVSTDFDAGTATLADGAAVTEMTSDEAGDASWTEYQAAAQFRLTAGSWGEMRFYRSAATDFYAVRLDQSAGTVRLDTVVAGVRTTLGTYALAPPTVHADVFYFVRVAVSDTGAGHQIQVFVDENLLATVVDGDHSAGKLAVACGVGSSMTIRLAELFRKPLESTRVGP